MPHDQVDMTQYIIDPPCWVEIRDRNGKLLFKFDPIRDIIWTRWQGADRLVDLRKEKEKWNERQSCNEG